MSIKRGDLVRVIAVEPSDVNQGFNVGDTYKVGLVDSDGDVCLIGAFKSLCGRATKVFGKDFYKDYPDGGRCRGVVLYKGQVELVNKDGITS